MLRDLFSCQFFFPLIFISWRLSNSITSAAARRWIIPTTWGTRKWMLPDEKAAWRIPSLQFYELQSCVHQRSLVGCSPWGHKELDMTEAQRGG